MTGSLALDEYMAERFGMLEPQYDIHSTQNPGSIKNNIKMPAVTVANQYAWCAAEQVTLQ